MECAIQGSGELGQAFTRGPVDPLPYELLVVKCPLRDPAELMEHRASTWRQLSGRDIDQGDGLRRRLHHLRPGALKQLKQRPAINTDMVARAVKETPLAARHRPGSDGRLGCRRHGHGEALWQD